MNSNIKLKSNLILASLQKWNCPIFSCKSQNSSHIRALHNLHSKEWNQITVQLWTWSNDVPTITNYLNQPLHIFKSKNGMQNTFPGKAMKTHHPSMRDLFIDVHWINFHIHFFLYIIKLAIIARHHTEQRQHSRSEKGEIFEILHLAKLLRRQWISYEATRKNCETDCSCLAVYTNSYSSRCFPHHAHIEN